uniref:SP_1767 family glycosyltransferase n=1 Tax=Ignavibacterium album TaxID=591197 RepID=A0A832DPK5_9BACT
MIKNSKLRYGKFFKLSRQIVKHFFSMVYPIVIRIWPLPNVLSIEETIQKIINEKLSIARFGDGEFLYIIDKLNLPFQKYEPYLAEKLKEILAAKNENILVGLPIGYHSLENLKKDSLLTWRSQITWIYPRLKKYLNLNYIYANASMTRLYMDYEDKSKCKYYFELIKKIWDGKEIILIEGEKSRLGLGNDLFNNAKKIERILAPFHNAYSRFDDILNETLKHSREKLILIALGPTSKALVYELSKNGYQAIDIGNIDIEYEWYLRGAIEKIKIPGKYTSEAIGGRIVEDVNDELYNSQIIARIY